MLGKATLPALLLPTLGLAQGPVVINEFLYDNLGGDNIEFVELYNRSGAPVDIGDWVLDSEDPNGPNTAYTIPTGTVLPAGGRWTIGADLANPGNIDQVVGTSNLWENSNESLTLRDPTGAIVDTLVYEAVRGIWDPTLAEGPAGIQQQFVTPTGRPYSLQRCPDGHDTDDNADDFVVMPYTPAAPNFSGSVLPFQGFFEDTPGTTVTEFIASFVDPTIIDPTVVANGNPNAIPASPTGGNAAIFWDPTGGGNSSYLTNECVGDFVFQACVYIDGSLTPANEGETWNIGRGTVGAFGHHTDPTGTFHASIGGTWLPGNSGIAVCHQRSDSFNKVMLVDYGDGTSLTVLHEIDIQQGVNDGWQQMRFSATGNSVSLTFAQTLFIGQVTTADAGGIYVGYREFRADNSLTRPPTLDDLLISGTSAQTRSFGVGCPANSPLAIDARDGNLPTLGSIYELQVDALPANSPLAAVMVGYYPSEPPLDLSHYGMTGCWQYIAPLSTAMLVPANQTAVYPIAIPNNVTMIGLVFFSQAVAVAPGANTLGATTSNGVEIRLGW